MSKLEGCYAPISSIDQVQEEFRRQLPGLLPRLSRFFLTSEGA